MGPCKEMGGSCPKKPQTPQALEKKNSFFLTVLVLHCRTQAFSSYGEWGLLLLWKSRLLTAVASLGVDHRSGARALGGAAHGLSCQWILGQSTAVRAKGKGKNSEAAGGLPDKEARIT